MVICDCEMLLPVAAGLLNQIQGLKTSITADGVTMKTEFAGAALRTDCLKNSPQGM